MPDSGFPNPPTSPKCSAACSDTLQSSTAQKLRARHGCGGGADALGKARGAGACTPRSAKRADMWICHLWLTPGRKRNTMPLTSHLGASVWQLGRKAVFASSGGGGGD